MVIQSDTSDTSSGLRFTARDAEEAARFLRQRYRQRAQVTSVKSVPRRGWRGWFGGTELLVTAQISPAVPVVSPPPSTAPKSPVAEPDPLPEEASTLRWKTGIDPAKRPPIQLAQLLERAGFSTSFRQRLREFPDWESWNEQPLHHALKNIGDRLRTQFPVCQGELQGRVAFLGVSGAGRTTALCKWLTSEVFQQGRKCQVVAVDFEQPECHERLSLHCELLGLPCYRQDEQMDSRDTIYYDMPAFPLGKKSEILQMGRYLGEHRIQTRILVLPAVYDTALLRLICAEAAPLRYTHLVFTHLDKLPGWARLWDFVLDTRHKILFFAMHSDLTQGMDREVVPSLLGKSFFGSLEEVAA